MAELFAVVLVLAVAIALGLFIYAHLATVALALVALVVLGAIGAVFVWVTDSFESERKNRERDETTSALKLVVSGLAGELPPDRLAVQLLKEGARIEFRCPWDSKEASFVDLVPSDFSTAYAEARVGTDLRLFSSIEEVREWLNARISAHRLYGDPQETLYGGRNRPNRQLRD